MDISTVYRTMTSLKELRLVTETDLGGDSTFEWAKEGPHHHLVCSGCGAISQLEHASLERLEADLLGDYGFSANLDHFAIFGTCRACREGAQPTAALP